MKTIRVFLADDHALVRAGIRHLIDALPDFSVVAEASSVQDARRGIDATNPDMVLTDISMGAESGLDLLRHLRRHVPAVPVVILSMHAADELVSEALGLGAAGYLLKEAAPAELEIALRSVAAGGSYMSPAISTHMVNRSTCPDAAVKGPLDVLTPRQIQILTMIASRKGTKEIAYELDLSEKTIAAHRAQIMERTGERDIVGLVLFAVRHGLVRPENGASRSV